MIFDPRPSNQGNLQPDSVGRSNPDPPDCQGRGSRLTGSMSEKPWERKPAKPATGTKLTPENVDWARARAKAAGRRYPNLVDNMAAARRQSEQERPTDGPDFLKRL